MQDREHVFLEHVLGFRDPVELCQVEAVSKGWSRLARADTLWAPLLEAARGQRAKRGTAKEANE